MRYFLVLTIISYFCVRSLICQFMDCYSDAGFDPDDGPLNQVQFTFLGALQYIHIKKGNPHYFRVPRVLLVHPMFVLSTALDAGVVPPGYALGNVVFGDYERDERECGIREEDIKQREIECDPAIMVMPIADVLLHPEYKHFGVKHSIALLKLLARVKSDFMLPVCLPDRDVFNQNTTKPIFVRHLDFISEAPRDFVEEVKEVTRVTWLKGNECTNRFPRDENTTDFDRKHLICTTGCGFQSGAPLVTHDRMGFYSLVAVAIGGPPCPDPLYPPSRVQLPYSIPMFKYNNWIWSAITGKLTIRQFKNDPFGYNQRSADPRHFHVKSNKFNVLLTKHKRKGWVGHWWMGGLKCFNRGKAAEKMYRFYFENIKTIPAPRSALEMTYYIQIDAPKTTIVDCVKVGMQQFSRLEPVVWGLDTSVVQIGLPVLIFKVPYRIQLEAWGHNQTFKKKLND